MNDKRAGEGYDITRIYLMGVDFPMYYGYREISFYAIRVTIDNDDNQLLCNKIKLRMKYLKRRQ